MSWNTHSELCAGAWGKEGNKELCLWSYLIIFLPRLLPFWKASSWRTPHTFWWIHSRSPRGAFRKLSVCSCLQLSVREEAREREEAGRRGEENLHNVWSTRRWVTPGWKQGSGFCKQTEGGETQRDFWEVKPPPDSSAFKVSLREHVQIQSWSTVKCLFFLIPSAARGLFWREICEADETKTKKKKNCHVFPSQVWCSEYESATANCNYPTRVGKCSPLKASPLHLQQCWASSDHTVEERGPLLCHMCLCTPLKIHFINNFTSPLHVGCRKH